MILSKSQLILDNSAERFFFGPFSPGDVIYAITLIGVSQGAARGYGLVAAALSAGVPSVDSQASFAALDQIFGGTTFGGQGGPCGGVFSIPEPTVAATAPPAVPVKIPINITLSPGKNVLVVEVLPLLSGSQQTLISCMCHASPANQKAFYS